MSDLSIVGTWLDKHWNRIPEALGFVWDNPGLVLLIALILWAACLMIMALCNIYLIGRERKKDDEARLHEQTEDEQTEADEDDDFDSLFEKYNNAQVALKNVREELAMCSSQRRLLSKAYVKLINTPRKKENATMLRPKHIIVTTHPLIGGSAQTVTAMAFDNLDDAIAEAQRRTKESTIEIYTLHARTRLPVPDIKVDEVKDNDEDEE